MTPLLLVAALALLEQDPAPAAPASPEPTSGYLLEPTPEEQLIGAVDLCVRWSPADPAHLGDVVMVNASGDAALDARVPDMVRDIPYPRPADDAGEWWGLSLSFGAAPPHAALPDCSGLPRTPQAND